MGYCGKNHRVSYQPCVNYICGDSCATANYTINADLPGYTARFYSQTQHEIFSEFLYNRAGDDYESNTKEIVKSLRGPPIEDYIPRSLVIDGGGSAVPANTSMAPKEKLNKKAVEEIEKARREVTGQKEIVLREVHIEELLLRRVISKEVVIRKKKR